MTIGTSTTTTKLFVRSGTGGLIRSQPTPTSLSDADATVTIAQLLTGIIYMIPTTNRTLTLPTAALAVAGISGVQINDCIDFTVINRATDASITDIAMGTGGTLIGNKDINPDSSSIFRLVFTNVTASSETYDIYKTS